MPVFSLYPEQRKNSCFSLMLLDAQKYSFEPQFAQYTNQLKRLVRPVAVFLRLPSLSSCTRLKLIVELVKYYLANSQKDTDWVVLPVTNFDFYFGDSTFSHKYKSRLPKDLFI